MRNNIRSGFNRNVARSGNFLQISTCWIGFSWSFGLTNSVAPNFWAAENAHMHYIMSRDLNTLLPVLLRHWTALGEWWGKKHFKNTLKNHSSFWRSNGFLLEFMKWILAQLFSTSSQNKVHGETGSVPKGYLAGCMSTPITLFAPAAFLAASQACDNQNSL